MSSSTVFSEEMVVASTEYGEACVPASTVCVSDCCCMALEFVQDHYVCTGCKKQCNVWKAPALFDAGKIKQRPTPQQVFSENDSVEIPVVQDATEPIAFEPPLAGADISPCGKYRWSLWRRFKETGKTILWILLNPSVADGQIEDNTVRRMMWFSKREGAALMVVCNLFAYRTTYPKELRKALKTQDEKPFEENLKHIQEQLNAADVCIVAWGNGGDIRNMARKLYGKLKPPPGGRKAHFVCLGVTKSGHPRHPLRLSNKTPLVPFEYAGMGEMDALFEEPL